MNNNTVWTRANWPAPEWLHAGTTFRMQGTSKGAYAGLNLADHVGDVQEAVFKNRQILKSRLTLPSDPVWLQQVHGHRILDLDKKFSSNEADGSSSCKNGMVCAVLTADCIPVLIFDATEHRIAAVHVGWRGFCQAIISAALNCFSGSPATQMAWIGPGISQRHYEVDDVVRQACLDMDQKLDVAFSESRSGHWYADLSRMIEISLRKYGMEQIYQCGSCTFELPEYFYSYRRDGITGRMATLIWMDQ